MKTELQIPESFIYIDAPVPPREIITAALGYEGPARYMGSYWGGGDEAYVNDGRLDGTQSWQGYLAFYDHPAVALKRAEAGIRSWEMGSSDNPATSVWIVDLQDQKLYIARWKAGMNFLASQWEDADIPVLSVFDPEALFKLITESVLPPKLPSDEELRAIVEENMRKEIEAVDALIEWMPDTALSMEQWMFIHGVSVEDIEALAPKNKGEQSE